MNERNRGGCKAGGQDAACLLTNYKQKVRGGGRSDTFCRGYVCTTELDNLSSLGRKCDCFFSCPDVAIVPETAHSKE
jgi:hypothetical protein